MYVVLLVYVYNTEVERSVTLANSLEGAISIVTGALNRSPFNTDLTSYKIFELGKEIPLETSVEEIKEEKIVQKTVVKVINHG